MSNEFTFAGAGAALGALLDALLGALLPTGAFLLLLLLFPAPAVEAPGGAMPGITRLRCTEGVNFAAGAAAPGTAVAGLAATILPTGAVSLLSSLERAPVLPVVTTSSKHQSKLKECIKFCVTQ